MNPKKLTPGQQVRVETPAWIVEQPDKNNPYFYIVQYGDGTRETVSVARLSPIYDSCKASIDEDATISVAPGRLSAAGAIDLYHWLRTHMQEFEAIVQPAEDEIQAS